MVRTYVPLSLSSIHDEGAARRLRCFLGPRAYKPVMMSILNAGDGTSEKISGEIVIQIQRTASTLRMDPSLAYNTQ